MSKIKSFMMLIIVTFFLTGCVKFNANMEIRKDKSLSYSIIYAMDKSLMDGEEIVTEDSKKELEEYGFKLEPYEEDNYKGVVVSKEFNNIDDISVGSDVSYNISGLLNGEAKNQEVFSVKKGFLKNIYTAKFDFSANNNDVSEPDENTDEYNLEEFNDSNEFFEEIMDNDISNNIDLSDNFSQMSNGMDLSFNVKLPYKAISNNATSVNNDNKELSWTMAADKVSNIEFSFALYNITNVYIAIGILFVIIIVALIMIFKRRK